MKFSKIRLIGFYHFPNQYMKPESVRIEEALELAPLLKQSIHNLYNNPSTDNEIKKVIETPTVFIFKDKEKKLIAYYTKDCSARLTDVKYARGAIRHIPFKYKAWFYPGEQIKLIDDSKTEPKQTNNQNKKTIIKKMKNVLSLIGNLFKNFVQLHNK